MIDTPTPTADDPPARRTGRGWVDDADLLQAVLTNPLDSHSQIAERLGCGKHTVSRRFNAPVFQQKLNAARDAKFEPARALAVAEVQRSIEALVAVRDDATASPKTRVAAAVEVIRVAILLEERAVALTRIARLEAAVEELSKPADHTPEPPADAVVDPPPADDDATTAHPTELSPEVADRLRSLRERSAS